MSTNQNHEIFETRRWVGQSEEYTGKFRVRVAADVIFNLPGKGGRVTKIAAEKVADLWAAGKSAGEISKLTGCGIA